MPSPVGILKIVASESGIIAVLWENDKPSRVKLPNLSESSAHPILNRAVQQLGQYFAGTRTNFDLPIEMRGTQFQNKVWQALQTIPYGLTKSYGQIANQINQPSACRAVGMANGRNPISIIVPCHRVIGSSGQLTGFAGGLDVKARLLQLERRRIDASVATL